MDRSVAVPTAPVAALPVGVIAPRDREALRPHRRTSSAWTLLYLVIDVVLIALAGVMSALGAISSGTPAAPLLWMLLFAFVTPVFFLARDLYGPRLGIHSLEDARSIVVATALAAMSLLTLFELAGRAGMADDAVRSWVFTSVYVTAGRIALYRWRRDARVAGAGMRPTLIIGAGRIAALTAERLRARPELGLLPVGFLDKEPLDETAEVSGLPVLGTSWDFDRVVNEHGIEHVVIAFSTAPHDVLLRIAAACEQRGIELSLVPRLWEKVTTVHTVEHLGGLPLLMVHPANPKNWQFAAKYALDRVIAAAMLVLLSPFLLLTALAILAVDGRPILFRQQRVGRDGRCFRILKFRTMHADGTTPTKLGPFLRSTSLDELPQLVNVVNGDMAFVGPRPERPELVSDFELDVYRYRERHRVKSGITGWAQVHGIGRGEDRFSSSTLARRVEWDNYYIENWSWWLDVKILLLTLAAVFRFAQRNDGPAPLAPPS